MINKKKEKKKSSLAVLCFRIEWHILGVPATIHPHTTSLPRLMLYNWGYSVVMQVTEFLHGKFLM